MNTKDKTNWISETGLPKSLTKPAYDAWYSQSEIIDGVRMGPPISAVGVMEKKQSFAMNLTVSEEDLVKIDTVDRLDINGRTFVSKNRAVDMAARFHKNQIEKVDIAKLSEELKAWRGSTGSHNSGEIVHFILGKLIQ